MCANKVRFFFTKWRQLEVWEALQPCLIDWGLEVYRLAAKCPNNNLNIMHCSIIQFNEKSSLCKCFQCNHFPPVCHQVWIRSSCAILCSHVHSICAKFCTTLEISIRYNGPHCNAVRQCVLNYISACPLSLKFLDSDSESEQSKKDQ